MSKQRTKQEFEAISQFRDSVLERFEPHEAWTVTGVLPLTRPIEQYANVKESDHPNIQRQKLGRYIAGLEDKVFGRYKLMCCGKTHGRNAFRFFELRDTDEPAFRRATKDEIIKEAEEQYLELFEKYAKLTDKMDRIKEILNEEA